MATFITTFKFTEEGIKAIDQTTKRAAMFKASAKKMGVKVTAFYWTLGQYDGLAIIEAADDETVAAVALQVGAMGNIHSTTVRAFAAAEMDKILAKMHG
jgi:uncharacterized protein with GYD domain